MLHVVQYNLKQLKQKYVEQASLQMNGNAGKFCFYEFTTSIAINIVESIVFCGQ